MLLQTEKICKRFAGTYALRDVSLSLEAGEVHGLVGENGAGKSTLIKILTGVYHMDEGRILWNGAPAVIESPLQSRQLGINVIHQDRNLVPAFNGIENIYLGLPYPRKAGAAVDWKTMRIRVEAVLADLGIEINLDVPAARLSPPERTLLEIARAMMTDCKLLILDEPTASLTDKESEMLFNLIGRLKQRGAACLYVTHRMDEIFRITDRITVFKNGEKAGTVATADVTKEQLIGMMTDQWSSEEFAAERQFGRAMLHVEHIASRCGVVKDASFTVREGEILGVFGLGGSGRTEMLECVYGCRPTATGVVTVDGVTQEKPAPASSIANGVVLICEDRRGMALVPGLSIKQNMALSTIDSYANILGVMDEKREQADAESRIESLRIKTTGPSQPVYQLSGGNQQKVVFGKALQSKPKVLLCDEPTQAVDVQTRAEIHKLLRRLAAEGNAIVFVSSDLKEVLEIADNVQIVSGGRTLQCMKNDGLTAEQVLACCYAD